MCPGSTRLFPSHPRPPAVHREAYCSTGYSPVLAFNVEDLQATLMRCLERGASMDGAIQHSPHGKASDTGRLGCVCADLAVCFRWAGEQGWGGRL